MRNFCWILFICAVATVSSFRPGHNRAQGGNAPVTSRRDQSVSLFKSSKDSILGRISKSLSTLVDSINTKVPGGLATVVTVPIATAATAVAIQNYLELGKTKVKKPVLNRYQCSGCGFTIFPAKNREEKFFSSSFTCPNCGAPKNKFVERH
ncbi:hypothetical protein X943_000102 [Babesia divergens]|uniref:Rubredoxin-like domain-containing protein n=1 Tax=Babesia divergens TaxID=32595 RepID=A0AAD9LGT2_BABDI|nr:hypothetical protein X943_000102 [Babesia divergens]